MRLIDADFLKKQMEAVCMGIMAGTDSYNAPLKTIDDAPTIEKPEWIPVSERLPETWKKVLTYGQRGFAIDCQALGGGWVFGDNITHWMPLPKTPKKDENAV